MKITVQDDVVKHSESLIVGFDVGKSRLNALSRAEVSGRFVQFEDEIPNRVRAISTCLRSYCAQASKLGLESVHVVCEPTGGYERKLLAAARRLGLTTEYVSGQAVHRCRTVESNDTGKSDHKDPGTIHTLARLGKTLSVRSLSGSYLKLRRLNEFYEDEDKTVVQIRTHLHAVIAELFVDWPLRAGFIYTGPGRVLVEQYGCSPYRIVSDGWKRFVKRMRSVGRGFRMATTKTIWEAAQNSVLHRQSKGVEEVLMERVRALRSDWERHDRRREAIKAELVEIYQSLPESKIFSSLPKRISPYLLARVIAETGPLRDFRHIRQLWRFAGLNIRERSSGKYVGQLKISKKGRSLLRKVLYQIAFGHLIVKGSLYSTWYRRKKAEQANGMKAIVAVMRHFLNCLHALVRSGKKFSAERLFLQDQMVA
jgi:transposase